MRIYFIVFKSIFKGKLRIKTLYQSFYSLIEKIKPTVIFHHKIDSIFRENSNYIFIGTYQTFKNNKDAKNSQINVIITALGTQKLKKNTLSFPIKKYMYFAYL